MAIADKTTVAFERSLGEVVGLLRAAGADNIAQMDGRAEFALQFDMGGRRIRFVIPFLTAAEVAKRTGPRQDSKVVAEQWRRQRGRALLLVVKAKLESVESGIETVEQAFLANVVTTSGMTVYDAIATASARDLALATPNDLPRLGAPR